MDGKNVVETPTVRSVWAYIEKHGIPTPTIESSGSKYNRRWKKASPAKAAKKAPAKRKAAIAEEDFEEIDVAAPAMAAPIKSAARPRMSTAKKPKLSREPVAKPVKPVFKPVKPSFKPTAAKLGRKSTPPIGKPSAQKSQSFC